MPDLPPRAVDLVFDPPASVSIYLDALLAAGRQREADVVRRGHRQASRAALDALEHAGVWLTRAEPGSMAPHGYDRAPVNPEIIEHGPGEHGADGGLHVHIVIRPSGMGILDRHALERVVPLARRRYERSLIDTLTAELGIRIRQLDGETQLAGVPDDLIASREPVVCRVRAAVHQLR